MGDPKLSNEYVVGRKSPARHASQTAVGLIMEGQDGHVWRVQRDSRGIHRWVRVDSKPAAEAVPRSRASSSAPRRRARSPSASREKSAAPPQWKRYCSVWSMAVPYDWNEVPWPAASQMTTYTGKWTGSVAIRQPPTWRALYDAAEELVRKYENCADHIFIEIIRPRKKDASLLEMFTGS